MAPSRDKRTIRTAFSDDSDEDGYSKDVGPRSSGFHPRNVKDENWTYVDYERVKNEYHTRATPPINNQVRVMIARVAAMSLSAGRN